MSPRRRTWVSLAVAILVGLPAGWILTFMATPILWRLEPVLNMELAGHSGPSDWVFYVGWAIVIPVLFLVFRKIGHKSSEGEPPATPRG
jgi:hypothetical protein